MSMSGSTNKGRHTFLQPSDIPSFTKVLFQFYNTIDCNTSCITELNFPSIWNQHLPTLLPITNLPPSLHWSPDIWTLPRPTLLEHKYHSGSAEARMCGPGQKHLFSASWSWPVLCTMIIKHPTSYLEWFLTLQHLGPEHFSIYLLLWMFRNFTEVTWDCSVPRSHAGGMGPSGQSKTTSPPTEKQLPNTGVTQCCLMKEWQVEMGEEGWYYKYKLHQHFETTANSLK